MIVAMAYDADPVSAVECVMQKPFEGAPGREHLNCALEPAVVSQADVGVASADVRNHDRIFAFEGTKEGVRGVAVVGRSALLIVPGCETIDGSGDLRFGKRRSGRLPFRCCPTIRSRARTRTRRHDRRLPSTGSIPPRTHR